MDPKLKIGLALIAVVAAVFGIYNTLSQNSGNISKFIENERSKSDMKILSTFVVAGITWEVQELASDTKHGKLVSNQLNAAFEFSETKARNIKYITSGKEIWLTDKDNSIFRVINGENGNTITESVDSLIEAHPQLSAGIDKLSFTANDRVRFKLKSRNTVYFNPATNVFGSNATSI